jgi:hypothetical protein
VNKFGPFGEVGGSNSKVGLGEKLGDNEDYGCYFSDWVPLQVVSC